MKRSGLLCFAETGRSVIHDLQSEVSGDYGKALLLLAEVLKPLRVLWRPVSHVKYDKNLI